MIPRLNILGKVIDHKKYTSYLLNPPMRRQTNGFLPEYSKPVKDSFGDLVPRGQSPSVLTVEQGGIPTVVKGQERGHVFPDGQQCPDRSFHADMKSHEPEVVTILTRYYVRELPSELCNLPTRNQLNTVGAISMTVGFSLSTL
jgi:hypothetical protein